MKALYNEKKRLVKEMNAVGFLLDQKIVERFGFHYSQTDSDPMIDTLDYGTQDMEYKDFIKDMSVFKEKQKNNDWTPNA